MPQALITVNAGVGSNTALPINTLVQLNNQNVGGELSYTWAILDQPPGAVDALSSVAVQNPTFTPKKEGSYLLRLIVNQGLPSEQENRVVCAVRQLKTLERIPAAGETTEADTSDGWVTSMNSMLRRLDGQLSDPGILVGVNASGSTRSKGDVVRATASSVIKTGLPGQETVPGFSLATAAVLGQVDELLAIVEGGVDGSTSVADGGLLKVRYIGRFSPATGSPAVGDTVYVSDAGALSLTAGTVRRRVGSVMAVSGGQYDVWFNGVGGADIDLTPIDRAYLVHGNPSTLPNAVRTDGTNATPQTTGFRFASGAAGTVPLTSKAFAGQTANLFEVLDSGNILLSGIDKDGDVFFNNAARRVQWPDWYLYEANASELRAQWGGGASFISLSSTTAPLTAVTAHDATGSELSMQAGSGYTRFNGTNHDLYFTLDGEDLWKISSPTNGGHLTSVYGALVRGISRPALFDDVATAGYIHETARLRNYLINTGFDVWQRGTTFSKGNSSGANVIDRIFSADRWYGGISTVAGASGDSVTVSRQAASNGISDCDYVARVQYAAAGPGSNTTTVYFVHELDRRLIKSMRGKRLNFSAYLRNVTFPAGQGITYRLKLITGTGSEDVSYASGYTGASTVADTGAQSIDTLGTTFVRKDAAGTLGASVTQGAVMLVIEGLGNGAGGTDGSMEIGKAFLTEQANAAMLAPWERMMATTILEARACEYYFQKSYAFSTVPGTNLGFTQDVPYFAWTLNVSTPNGARMPFTSHIAFRSQMRGKFATSTPIMTFYDPAAANTTGFMRINAAQVAVSAFLVSDFGCIIANNTGGNYNPGATHLEVYGHWTCDCEI